MDARIVLRAALLSGSKKNSQIPRSELSTREARAILTGVRPNTEEWSMRKFAVYLFGIFVIAAVLLPTSSVAQESSNPNSHNDKEMDMPGMNGMSSNQIDMQPH